MATREDFEAATGPGGALETLVEARRQGLICHIGFPAHNADVALKLLDTFPFDSVLFPANWVNFFNGNFGPQILARTAELGIGRLALKAMARTPGAGVRNATRRPGTSRRNRKNSPSLRSVSP